MLEHPLLQCGVAAGAAAGPGSPGIACPALRSMPGLARPARAAATPTARPGWICDLGKAEVQA